MKLVYTHENRLFVANAYNLLEQNGIAAVWKNEFTSSAIGEVAPISAWPELWVMEDTDYNRAHTIISNAFAPNNLPEWVCAQCQETNEPAFELCWNCQSEKPESAL